MPAEHGSLYMQANNVYHCGKTASVLQRKLLGEHRDSMAWHDRTALLAAKQDMQHCSVWSMVWELADTGLQLAIIKAYLKHNVLALAVVYQLCTLQEWG